MFTPTSRGSVGQEVFDQFIRLLSSGVYKPGEKLPSESEMSEQLQVSRPILREVVSALRYMGYLDSVQGGGTYVCQPMDPSISQIKLKLKLDKAHLLSLWEFRYCIEMFAAELAAERATDEEIALIRNMPHVYSYPDDITEEGDRIFQRQDILFHSAIAKATHNEMLSSILENTADLLATSRNVTSLVHGAGVRSAACHKRIVDAIFCRNASLAKSAMEIHLFEIRDDLILGADLIEK